MHTQCITESKRQTISSYKAIIFVAVSIKQINNACLLCTKYSRGCTDTQNRTLQSNCLRELI